MKFRLSDNSDASWETFGKTDPYYGVLSADKFRRDNINDETLKEFFQSGEVHVDQTLELVRTHFANSPGRVAALDFGCGVGRLVLPLATRFQHVVGIDISDAYIAEAVNNCSRAGAGNVEFFKTLDALQPRRGTFDFAHSYITFIHIDFERGKKIIEDIVRLLRPGGVAALHIMFRRDIGSARRFLNRLRTTFLPLNWIANVLGGRPAFEPLMQANVYSLDALLSALHQLGVRSSHVEVSHNAGNWHAYLFVQKD